MELNKAQDIAVKICLGLCAMGAVCAVYGAYLELKLGTAGLGTMYRVWGGVLIGVSGVGVTVTIKWLHDLGKKDS